MEEIKAQLDALETEHRVLSERFAVLTDFMMNTIALLAEEEDREVLRDTINRLIIATRQSGRYDTLNDAQDLLRAFERVMPPPVDD